jgi:hypothetical protein
MKIIYLLSILLSSTLYTLWIFIFAKQHLPYIIVVTNILMLCASAFFIRRIKGIIFFAIAVFASYLSSLLSLAITQFLLYPPDQFSDRLLSTQAFIFPIFSLGFLYGVIFIIAIKNISYKENDM